MKRLHWVNSADLTELKGRKESVRWVIGEELRRLQQGGRPLNYRVLHGFGTQVGELKRGRLRVVYTTECPEVIALVCIFDKDAKDGDRMRPEHARLIERRLRTLRSSDVAQPTNSTRIN